MANRTKRIVIVSLILAAALLVSGASAITINSFDMDIAENGDTTLNFDYSLSALESFAVLVKIADPAAELQNAIDQRTDQEVEVLDATSSSTILLVPEYIKPESTSEGTTYTTPSLDFSQAEDILKEYWFASLITIDLSPGITTITFPDGYSESFTNNIQIPSVTHTI